MGLSLSGGDVTLLVVAFAAAIWVLVPAVAYSLRLTRLHARCVRDPAAVEPKGDDPDYEKRYRQFTALGFQPIGTSRESGWFINSHKWFWRSRGTRWMAMPDGRTLVTFHRMLDDEPIRFGAVTTFERGGLVRTACPGAGVAINRAGYLRVEYPDIEPEQLIAKHAEHVEAFTRRHGKTVKPATLEDIVSEEEAKDNELLRGGARGSYGRPIVFLALPVLLASRIGSLPGPLWRRAAIGICAGAAFAALDHFVLDRRKRRKRLTQARSAKLAARRRAPGNLDRDMRTRFAFAKDLARDERRDEATEQFAWLWKNMARVEPAMTGVRLSYLVSEIEKLIPIHPPARRRFEEIRAEAAAAADANPGLHAPRVDWVSLNQMLGDDEATLAWFDAVKADPLSELVFEAVEDRLIDIFKRRDRWADVGRLYSDPLAKLEQLQRMRRAADLPMAKAMLGKEAYARMTGAMMDHFRRAVADMVAGLRAAGRDGEAQAVADRARAIDPTEDMRRTLESRPR